MADKNEMNLDDMEQVSGGAEVDEWFKKEYPTFKLTAEKKCPRCGSEDVYKEGDEYISEWGKYEMYLYRCRACSKGFFHCIKNWD